MQNNTEILAPAGDYCSFKTAINNGADAVYLGVDNFNARKKTLNFKCEELKSVADYAHLFNVKVYLTLNVVVLDNEFDKILKIVQTALDAKIDAFILQDIGLATYLKKVYPNIILHASTQMGVHNLEGAKFLQEIGFSRIILSRETSLDDIYKIKQNCNIELEFFVQGALCVSFSGNCYLCSLLAKSSGNRGECKQFCRLNYELSNNEKVKKGYLLSAKDICLAKRLKQLVDAGITSFKIEGRARRQAYVGQCVRTYKKIIENNFVYSQDDITNLKKSFNRGDYVEGYFYDNSVIYDKTPSHIGIHIGKIDKVNNGKKFNEIFVKTNYKLKKEDVIKCLKNDRELATITVKDIKQISSDTYRITTKNAVDKGCEVRLIVDGENELQIKNAKRRVNVEATFIARVNQKPQLTLTTNFSSITVFGNETLENSKTCSTSKDMCKLQISKMGDEFFLENFDCFLDDVFIAKSVLNNLRRNAIELLRKQIIADYEKRNNLQCVKFEKNTNLNFVNEEKTKSKMVVINNLKDIYLLNKKYELYIYQPSEYKLDIIKLEYEKFKNYSIFLNCPIMATHQEIKKLQEIIKFCKNWGVCANNYYALNFVKPEKTIIGTGLNVVNSHSINFYSSLGYKKILLSIEDFDYSNIKNSGAQLFIMNNYYPELMYFNHCPIKEHFNSKCNSCLYNSNYVYSLNGKSFSLIRRKIINCRFVLKSITKKVLQQTYTFSICEEFCNIK